MAADQKTNHKPVQIYICGNRRPKGHKRGSCAAKGSAEIRDYFKARLAALGLDWVQVNQSGCMDRCAQGPCALIYTDGVAYRLASAAAVDEVIRKHLIEGGRAEELRLRE